MTNRSPTLFWVTAFAAIACLVALPNNTKAQEGSSEPICSAVGQDPCIVENFNSMPTGGYGTSFTSSAGFYFEVLNQLSTNTFFISDHINLRNTLGIACYSTEISLPEPREYVTLLFRDTSIIKSLNVLALDSSGQIIDASTKQNNTAPDGVEAIKLGPAPSLISSLVLHCVGGACGLASTDPRISEIRACNISAN